MIRIINNKYYGVTSSDHLYPIPLFDGEIFIYQLDFSDYKHLLCKYQIYNNALIFRDYEDFYITKYNETKQLCISLTMFFNLVMSSNVEYAAKMIICNFYKIKNPDSDFKQFDSLIKELKNFTKKYIKLTL